MAAGGAGGISRERARRALRRGACATRSRGSRRPARRSSPTASSASQSFATYPSTGSPTLGARRRQDPVRRRARAPAARLTAGPFRYRDARRHLPRRGAQPHAHRPVKQAVISASALSLLYPADGIDGYSRESFLDDLVDEAETDIRGCLDAGADSVQIDFTEGRLVGQARPVRRAAPQLHRPEQPRARRGSPPRSASGSASTPAPAATTTRPTAPTSTTPSCCPACSSSRPATSTSSSPSEADRAARARGDRASTRSRTSGSSSASSTRSTRASRRPRRSATGCCEAARVHPARTARHDRRLRLLAVRRRPLDRARDGVREDPRAASRAPSSPRRNSAPSS